MLNWTQPGLVCRAKVMVLSQASTCLYTLWLSSSFQVCCRVEGVDFLYGVIFFVSFWRLLDRPLFVHNWAMTCNDSALIPIDISQINGTNLRHKINSANDACEGGSNMFVVFASQIRCAIHVVFLPQWMASKVAFREEGLLLQTCLGEKKRDPVSLTSDNSFYSN